MIVVRYADDFVILVHGTRDDVQAVHEQIADVLVLGGDWKEEDPLAMPDPQRLLDQPDLLQISGRDRKRDRVPHRHSKYART